MTKIQTPKTLQGQTTKITTAFARLAGVDSRVGTPFCSNCIADGSN